MAPISCGIFWVPQVNTGYSRKLYFSVCFINKNHKDLNVAIELAIIHNLSLCHQIRSEWRSMIKHETFAGRSDHCDGAAITTYTTFRWPRSNPGWLTRYFTLMQCEIIPSEKMYMSKRGIAPRTSFFVVRNTNNETMKPIKFNFSQMLILKTFQSLYK